MNGVLSALDKFHDEKHTPAIFNDREAGPDLAPFDMTATASTRSASVAKTSNYGKIAIALAALLANARIELIPLTHLGGLATETGAESAIEA
jgi:hypothetical protein